MRTLILSCNTGQGHNAAGRAVLEAFLARGEDCEMKDALSFASQRASEIISKAYLKMTVETPWLFGGLYKAGDFIRSDRRKSPVYLANIGYAERLMRYIEEREIDAVVAPHLFPAEAMTHLREKRGLPTRFYVVVTDYTCIPFWEETQADLFFIPHADLTGEFAERGIPRKRLAVTGIPVSRQFVNRAPREEARDALGIERDERLFVVMTGSMGYGNVLGLLRSLAAHRDSSMRFVVLTGHNADLKASIDEAFADDRRVQAMPFIEEVPLYMDACDLLLTKPGGLTSTEAAVKNVPILHTEPIPGCETRNARFFEERGMSRCVRGGDALTPAMDLLNHPDQLEAMRAAQRRHMRPGAADDICDRVARDAQREAGLSSGG